MPSFASINLEFMLSTYNERLGVMAGNQGRGFAVAVMMTSYVARVPVQRISPYTSQTVYLHKPIPPRNHGGRQRGSEGTSPRSARR